MRELAIGVVLGLAAGVAPGPQLALVIVTEVPDALVAACAIAVRVAGLVMLAVGALLVVDGIRAL